MLVDQLSNILAALCTLSVQARIASATGIVYDHSSA